VRPGSGHCGVFSGKKLNAQIYPVVRNVVLASD
jgi:poly-beta-hydroxyalkanoate depolymerase